MVSMKKRDIIPTLLDTASLGSALGAIFSYIDWSNHVRDRHINQQSKKLSEK